jgi:hypothetical protein
VNLLTYYLPGLWHNFLRLSTFGFERQIACVVCSSKDKIDIDAIAHLSLPAHAMNNPARYTDPSGHCPFCIAAAVGGVIGAGVNIYAQYQEGGSSFQLKDLNWKEVAVSAGVGAVAGLVGAAVILPAATAIGTGVAAATGSSAIGIGADLAVGGFMAGTTNVLLSNTQRVTADAIHGKEVTLESVSRHFNENYAEDLFYGALGYGIAKGLGTFGRSLWAPSETIGNPRISKPLDGVGPLLNPGPTQRIITGVAQAAAESASNSTLLQFGTREKRLLRMEEMFIQ